MANRWLSERPFPFNGLSKLTSEQARDELLFWLSIPYDGIYRGKAQAGIFYCAKAKYDCSKPDGNRLIGRFGHHFLSFGRGCSGSYMHDAVQMTLDSCRHQAGIRGGMEMKVDERLVASVMVVSASSTTCCLKVAPAMKLRNTVFYDFKAGQHKLYSTAHQTALKTFDPTSTK